MTPRLLSRTLDDGADDRSGREPVAWESAPERPSGAGRVEPLRKQPGRGLGHFGLDPERRAIEGWRVIQPGRHDNGTPQRREPGGERAVGWFEGGR